MRYLILVLVVIGGAGIPVQVAANKRLENAVQSPALSIALAFAIGAVAMAALAATGWLGRGQVGGATTAPWWAWVGGLLSAFVVIVSIIALPHAGTATVVAATVFGQLIASAILDHFGWMGVPLIRLNGWRICGAVLLFAGASMMQHK
jgi:bacterial/archaeal transporter family-2 protein